MNMAQKAILVTFLVVPYMFLLLPAFKGSYNALFDFIYIGLPKPMVDWVNVGDQLPSAINILLPAVLSATLAGMSCRNAKLRTQDGRTVTLWDFGSCMVCCISMQGWSVHISGVFCVLQAGCLLHMPSRHLLFIRGRAPVLVACY